MEGISTAGSVLGAGFQAFLNDWDKVVVAAGGASLLALGYFTAKRATGNQKKMNNNFFHFKGWLK